MASVAGPRPACGVHLSGSVVRGPAVRPVRCPAPSGVQSPGSSSRIRCPAVWCPPVRCPALWCPPPSVRTRPSGPPSGGGGWGSADAARQPAPRERAQVPVGCRVVERLGSTASRPGRERRRRGHPWSAGRSVADPGRVGCERRPGLTLASPGRPGQPADRPSQAAALWAREEAAAEVAAPPPGCRPRDGWATTMRGCRGACRPRGRARRG